MSTDYGLYRNTINDLDFMADRLLEVVEESKGQEALEIEPRRLDEARRLLRQSDMDIDQFANLEHHQVKDLHVTEIKNQQLQNEAAANIMADRKALQTQTDELELTLGQMRSLQTHVGKVKDSYVDFVAQSKLQAAEMAGLEQFGMGHELAQDAVEREIVPQLDRLLDKLDRTIHSFHKELDWRLDKLAFLGRQIAWLRGGTHPMRLKYLASLNSEPVDKEDDQTEEGPTQAEALLEHQDDQLEAMDIHDVDRGRSDERQRGRGGRGRKNEKK